jgi:hypothetical protein
LGPSPSPRFFISAATLARGRGSVDSNEVTERSSGLGAEVVRGLRPCSAEYTGSCCLLRTTPSERIGSGAREETPKQSVIISHANLAPGSGGSCKRVESLAAISNPSYQPLLRRPGIAHAQKHENHGEKRNHAGNNHNRIKGMSRENSSPSARCRFFLSIVREGIGWSRRLACFQTRA